VSAESMIFVSLVLAGMSAWAVAYLAQRRLPESMQGLWPSAFQALRSAARDQSHPAHRLVRVYTMAWLVFGACMVLALGVWFGLGVAAAA
jgi:hypothetical protein